VELLECADGALHRAKKNGKNKIELDEALVSV
jgi:PleD family two-component response regulator